MINISYHSWKDYRECPKKYFLKNRRKLPATIPRNDYYTLYGKLTEKFFEYFSNNWRFKTPYMSPENIKQKLTIIYENILKGSTVNWDVPFITESKEDIFNISYENICSIMDSQNQNYFLSSKSEVSIEVSLKDDMCIRGRIDFIHLDALDKSVIIFDGKGTAKIGKNIEDSQVLLYALLYFLHFKKMPQGLGYFYYRFNTFKPVDIDLNILNEFRAVLSLDLKKILKDSSFSATPCPKSCKYCDYRNTCQECMEDQAKRSKGSKLNIPNQGEVVEIGF